MTRYAKSFGVVNDPLAMSICLMRKDAWHSKFALPVQNAS